MTKYKYHYEIIKRSDINETPVRTKTFKQACEALIAALSDKHCTEARIIDLKTGEVLKEFVSMC